MTKNIHKQMKSSKPTKLFKNTLDNSLSEATSKNSAWATIRADIKLRNYLNNTNIPIPTFDQIIEVTDTNE